MKSHEFPKKGEIYWVKLDPTDGKEIKKTRPCVIISSDIANKSELIVVAPITSQVDRIFPHIEVPLTVAGKPGKVVPRHMRSIDRAQRLGKKLGKITDEEQFLLDNALKIILGL